MKKKLSAKDIITIATIFILPIVLYRVLMYFIVEYDLSPVWFSIALLYAVLIIPQHIGMNAVRDVYWIQDDDFDGSTGPRTKLDFVPFLNDLAIKDYFIDGMVWKTVVYYLTLISSFLMILSILYVNALVVFLDFGATLAYIMIYTMFASTIAYFLLKAIIVGTMLKDFTSPLLIITSVIYLLGFAVLALSIKSYVLEVHAVEASHAMGEDDI